jgi:hypothetical protein
MSDDWALSEADVAELLAILDTPESELARTAAIGRKGRRKCKRTPLHPHCKSVKWARVYQALRRKGKSKKNAAQIANSMHNKWLQGRIKRKAWP